MNDKVNEALWPSGEVISLNGSNRKNPTKRKSGREIRSQLNSVVQTTRNHAMCQPGFCSFFGGSIWNCNGTRKENVTLESHTVWANNQSLGPEWTEVVKGTYLEFED